MDKVYKIRVEDSTFREIWAEEWTKLEEELQCSIDPNDKNSFRMRYPNIHKLLIGTLNQIRYIGTLEGRIADKESEIADWCAENGILDDDRPDFESSDETCIKLQKEIDAAKEELKELSK